MIYSNSHIIIEWSDVFSFFGPKGIKLIVADYFLKVPLFVVIDDQGRSAFLPFVRPDLHFLWTSSSSTRSPSSTPSLSSKSLGPKPAYGWQGLAGGSHRASGVQLGWIGSDDFSWQTDRHCIIIYILSTLLSCNQKWPLYCPQGSGTLRQQLLMMHGIAWYCMVLHCIA